jgi:hypothetical protein
MTNCQLHRPHPAVGLLNKKLVARGLRESSVVTSERPKLRVVRSNERRLRDGSFSSCGHQILCRSATRIASNTNRIDLQGLGVVPVVVAFGGLATVDALQERGLGQKSILHRRTQYAIGTFNIGYFVGFSERRDTGRCVTFCSARKTETCVSMSVAERVTAVFALTISHHSRHLFPLNRNKNLPAAKLGENPAATRITAGGHLTRSDRRCLSAYALGRRYRYFGQHLLQPDHKAVGRSLLTDLALCDVRDGRLATADALSDRFLGETSGNQLMHQVLKVGVHELKYRRSDIYSQSENLCSFV